MPVTAQWDNEDHTVLRINYEGKLTIGELAQEWSHSRTLLDTIDHSADIVMDFRTTQGIPPNSTSAFGQIKLLAEHPNAGLILIVGANLMVQTFAKIFLQMFAGIAPRVEFVDTLEEAYTRLAEFDSTTQT